MVELIVTIVLIGILSIAIVPRFADVGIFEARGFHDETKSLLRWAQKSAVAQRRTVCVAINAGGVTLTIDTNTPADGVCDGPLALPATPHGGGSSVLGGGTPFNFLPSGMTSVAAIPAITVSGADSISVDPVTGYVR